MSDKYLVLESDECVLIEQKASRQKPAPNIAQTLLKVLDNGKLFLTNKRVIFQWRASLLSKQPEELSISLDEIKVIDGLAQAKPSKSDREDFSYQIVFFLIDRQETFFFPVKTPSSDIKNWIQEINRLLTGESKGWNPKDIGFIDVRGAFGAVKKNVSDAVETAKHTTGHVAESAIPVAKSAFEVAKPLIPVAAAAAAAMPSPAGKLAGAVLGTIGSLGVQDNPGKQEKETPQPPTEHSDDPFDLKLEQIKKLKELLDCGVLTQEEFDAKKREMLGL